MRSPALEIGNEFLFSNNVSASSFFILVESLSRFRMTQEVHLHVCVRGSAITHAQSSIGDGK